jgi:hypothetical protein
MPRPIVVEQILAQRSPFVFPPEAAAALEVRHPQIGDRREIAGH